MILIGNYLWFLLMLEKRAPPVFAWGNWAGLSGFLLGLTLSVMTAFEYFVSISGCFLFWPVHTVSDYFKDYFTVWFFSNGTVWNDVPQRVYILESRTMLHLKALKKLFMAYFLPLLICYMILYCANVNFHHEISDAKNSTPWFTIYKIARSLDRPTIRFFYAESASPRIYHRISRGSKPQEGAGT